MANRPTIMGTRHVIAAGHYLAAHAGFQILEGGGNAVDAGVASGIAMGVLQTDKVSFGGVAPLIVYLAKKKEIHCIDGLGVWPKAITPDFFQKFHGGKIPPNELRSVVPAAPDSWITALERFGTMTFGEVASAAIRFASEGFPMYPLMAEFITHNQASYERYPASKKIFLPKGKPPVPGELFVQADLGRTLQYMADVEKANKRKGRRLALRAARDAFYKGDIAAAIVKHHQKVGGLMRMEDFAEFNVKFEPTVKAKFKGVEVHACGPWSQGPVLPMALNILKNDNLEALGHNSPEYIHVVTEALKLAFADRHQHFGDPNFVKVPIKGLMSDEVRGAPAQHDQVGPRVPRHAAGGRSRNHGRSARSLDDARRIGRSAGTAAIPLTHAASIVTAMRSPRHRRMAPTIRLSFRARVSCLFGTRVTNHGGTRRIRARSRRASGRASRPNPALALKTAKC